MGEKPIHNQSVESNDDAWTDGSKEERKVYGNPFLLRIGILDSVIPQRKMLMIWLDSIKGIEAKK